MAKGQKKVTSGLKKMTDDERLAMIGSLYVERDIGKDVFAQIERLRKLAKIMDEPESMMVIGDTGMGKTTLLKNYLSMYPPTIVNNCIVRPILFVSLPVYTNIRGAAIELLRGLEVPGAEQGTLLDRTHQIIVQLDIQKVEVVLVDEAQHVVEASGAKSLPKVGDFFKDISKKSKVPFVLTGMPKTQQIFAENGQLQRLCRVENIGPFTARSDDEFLTFRKFLTAVDKKLPFPSRARIGDPENARLIFIATEGKIYNVMKLIREAAILAVEDKASTVQRDHLMRAFAETLDARVAIQDNPFDPAFTLSVLAKATSKAV